MNITWNLDWMREAKSQDGLTDVIIDAGWRCTGTDTIDGKEYSSSIYSSVSFPAPSPAAFTPYQDVTEAQVWQWIWEQVDKDATEGAVAQQIALQADPPVVNKPFPWA